MGSECKCLVVWTFFSTTLLGNWDEDWPFPVATAISKFPVQICWHIECCTLTESSRILNYSAGISLPPLALLAAVLPKVHLTSHSWMSGSRWMTTPLWLSGSLRSFLYSSSVYSCSSWSLLLLLGLYHFCPLLCPSLHEMLLCNLLQATFHAKMGTIKISHALGQKLKKKKRSPLKSEYLRVN